MRTSSLFLIGAGAFGLLTAGLYWFLSYEDAGSVLLLLMGTAAAFVGVYMGLRGRHQGRYAEDDPEAEHEREAGATVGSFSEGSVWPLVMGIGLVIGVQGFVYGAWLLVFGGALFAWAVFGLMQESRH